MMPVLFLFFFKSAFQLYNVLTKEFKILEEQKARLSLEAAFAIAPFKAYYGNTTFRNLQLLLHTVMVEIPLSLFVFSH